MANQLLQKADAEAIFDSIAKAYLHMLVAVGTADAEASTLAKCADNLYEDVLAIVKSDDNLWLSDLTDGALKFKNDAVMSAYFMGPAGDIVRTIERHVCKRDSDYKTINDWLEDKGIKVHPFVRMVYAQISVVHTWPLALSTTSGTHLAGHHCAALG